MISRSIQNKFAVVATTLIVLLLAWNGSLLSGQATAFTFPPATAILGRFQEIVPQNNLLSTRSMISIQPSQEEAYCSGAVSCRHTTTSCSQLFVNIPGQDDNINDEQKVVLGGKEYYDGFLSRKVDEEPIERVSGDNLLKPILKFVGVSTVIIGGFLLAFLASNDLL